MTGDWLRRLAGAWGRSAPRRPRAPRRRPGLEPLEDRLLPSTLTALPTAPPLATVSSITLQLQGPSAPAGDLLVSSAHGGETFVAGGQAQPDPFAVVMPAGPSSPLLAQAAA